MGGPGRLRLSDRRFPGPLFCYACGQESGKEAAGKLEDDQLKGPFLALAAAMALGACTLPTNVKIKKTEELRAAQTACLASNLPQFEDGSSEPSKVGRFVAMSCTVETEKLVYYAVPHPTAQERKAFEDDAVMRATKLVMQKRGGQF